MIASFSGHTQLVIFNFPFFLIELVTFSLFLIFNHEKYKTGNSPTVCNGVANSVDCNQETFVNCADVAITA
jgi:hypothetical protein